MIFYTKYHYLHTRMTSQLDNFNSIKNQFTEDLTPPQLDKEYKLCLDRSDTGFLLIHKLVYFPNLLQQYLETNEGKNEVNKTTLKENWLALHIASIFGLKESVKLLLLYTQNVNVKHNKGGSPLMLACKYSNTTSNIETVKLLLNHPQIDVNLQDNSGWSALMFACVFSNTKSNIETVKLLLNRPQIDVNLQDNIRWSALMMSCRYSNITSKVETVKLLLNHNEINVNLQSNTGWSSLMMACRYSNNDSNTETETVKLLLSHPQINVNLRNNEGWTSLMHACRYSNTETVKLLLLYPDIDTTYLSFENLKLVEQTRKEIQRDLFETINEYKKLQELDIGSLLYHQSKQYI